MRGAGRSAVVAIVLTSVWAAAGQAQEVRSRTYEVDDRTVLLHELEVPASLAETWTAFTTAEGLMAWAAPFARIDFRVGGLWESSYDTTAVAGDPDNIRTRILAYVPHRMIAMQAVEAPPDFPHPEVLEDLFSVVEFEPVSADTTRVTMYGVGYRDTPAHRAVLEMFRGANQWTLIQLHTRFRTGPVQWTRPPGGSGG